MSRLRLHRESHLVGRIGWLRAAVLGANDGLNGQYQTTEHTSLTHKHRQLLENGMTDKDRIEGSAKQIKGAAKEVVGKVIGDAKLQSEGKADKIEGKIQNAVGGLKDTLKGK